MGRTLTASIRDRERSERGFTLVELIIVVIVTVMIIGGLVAVVTQGLTLAPAAQDRTVRARDLTGFTDAFSSDVAGAVEVRNFRIPNGFGIRYDPRTACDATRSDTVTGLGVVRAEPYVDLKMFVRVDGSFVGYRAVIEPYDSTTNRVVITRATGANAATPTATSSVDQVLIGYCTIGDDPILDITPDADYDTRRPVLAAGSAGCPGSNSCSAGLTDFDPEVALTMHLALDPGAEAETTTLSALRRIVG